MTLKWLSARAQTRTMSDFEQGVGVHASALLPVPSVMASPPTVTMGTANGAAMIAGGVILHRADDQAFEYRGLAMVDAEASTTVAGSLMTGYITSSAHPYHVRVAFDMDGDKVELRLRTISTSLYARVWVEGQPHAADMVQFTGLTAGASHGLLVDFSAVGGRAFRKIIVEITNCQLNYIRGAKVTTFWPTSTPRGPNAVWIGDSFTENAAGPWWNSWAIEMGRRLGWNVFTSAVGATGYLANGSVLGKVKYRDRFTSDVTALDDVLPGGIDIVGYAGGYNDLAYGATPTLSAQLATEAGLLFDQCADELPNATQLVVLPFTAVGPIVDGTYSTAIRDAIKGEADDRGILSIDPTGGSPPNTPSWITSAGYQGNTNALGNADYYIHTDAVHPSSPDGSIYLGRRAAHAFSGVLT